MKMLANSKIFVRKRNMCIWRSEILYGEKLCPGFYFLYCQSFLAAFYEKDAEKYREEDAPVKTTRCQKNSEKISFVWGSEEGAIWGRVGVPSSVFDSISVWRWSSPKYKVTVGQKRGSVHPPSIRQSTPLCVMKEKKHRGEQRADHDELLRIVS